MQKQIDEIKGALPKFAIPMREVGDRFQNIYFAAKGGNWALAAYMSKYMNGASNPAKVTKPGSTAAQFRKGDLGYGIGALGLGLAAHSSGSVGAAFWFVANSMFLSGLLLWIFGEETHRRLNPA